LITADAPAIGALHDCDRALGDEDDPEEIGAKAATVLRATRRSAPEGSQVGVFAARSPDLLRKVHKVTLDPARKARATWGELEDALDIVIAPRADSVLPMRADARSDALSVDIRDESERLCELEFTNLVARRGGSF
jgi:hypothetical protein